MAGSLVLHHDGLSRPLENPRLRVLSLGAGVQIGATTCPTCGTAHMVAEDCPTCARDGRAGS